MDATLTAARPIGSGGRRCSTGSTWTDDGRAVERLLAPVVPVDILCIGLNYRDHAAETGAAVPANPMLFIKASNTLNDPGAAIPLPRLSDRVDYEAELAVVIGRTAKDVSAADAMSHVFGYTVANDVSARDWQKDRDLGGGQFARGKSFDGFCPLGPCLVTADEVPDPQAAVGADDGQRRGDAGRDDGRHDLPGGAADRVAEQHDDAAAGAGDPDRHAGRRGRRAAAAGVPAGRGRGRRGGRAASGGWRTRCGRRVR